jgi:hypothetical protein
MRMTTQIAIPGIRVDQIESLQLSGRRIDREPDEGEAVRFLVEAGGSGELVVAYIKWARGEPEVKALEARGTAPIRKLEGRRRLGVRRSHKGDVVDLELVSPDDDGWPTRYKATIEKLDEAAGVDVGGLLRRHGAKGINTRERDYWETNHADVDICVPSSIPDL